MIIIIDELNYFESHPEEELYGEDLESLTELFSEYSPGIYKMEVLSREKFEGQEGEYGGWEAPPYNIIDEIDMIKIGEVLPEYRTKMYYDEIDEDRLSEKFKTLQDWVNSFSTDTDKYLLINIWHELSFCKQVSKDTDTWFMSNPIKSYSTELTDKNLDFIKEDIQHYFDTIKKI